MLYSFYESLVRPVFFRFDPEAVHELTLKMLGAAGRSRCAFMFAQKVPDHPVEVMGLRFRNPVGLAAGLDKNAVAVDGLGNLGFGFIEVGTVTPLPQSGNPKKRLFRIIPAEGIINRMGFNNDGVDALVRNVELSNYRQKGGILGINIGKNKVTPLEKSLDDYLICMDRVYRHADYITVNISSPNTPDLRKLQFGSQFDELLAGLKAKQGDLEKLHGRHVPLAVKIAPDLTDDELGCIAEGLLKNGIDAVIATNTTVSRKEVFDMPHSYETGGLSGRPLQSLSTSVIRKLHGILQDRIPIIGAGGIDSVSAAREKMDAGAKLVQIYTGFIYHGPRLIRLLAENL